MIVLALSNELDYFELFGREVHRHDPFVKEGCVQRG